MKRTVITKCAWCLEEFTQEVSDTLSHPPKRYHNFCRIQAMKVKFGRAKFHDDDINLAKPKL